MIRFKDSSSYIISVKIDISVILIFLIAKLLDYMSLTHLSSAINNKRFMISTRFPFNKLRVYFSIQDYFVVQEDLQEEA